MQPRDKKWRPGKVRPVPGNAPHDRPVSRGMISLKARLRRSLEGHSCYPRTVTSQHAFSRHDGIYRFDVVQNQKPDPGAGAVPPPVGRPRARVEGRAGRITPLLIVRDEFRPAIPRSGCSPAAPVSASPARADYHGIF